jgi:hypothetical protein
MMDPLAGCCFDTVLAFHGIGLGANLSVEVFALAVTLSS